MLRALEGPAGFGAALFATPLVSYTAVLLADTAVPTWNGAHKHLPFVFASSASLAGAGLAMLTTPVAETRPARVLAVLGAIARSRPTKVMERSMDPVLVEPLHHGAAGHDGPVERAADRRRWRRHTARRSQPAGSPPRPDSL